EPEHAPNEAGTVEAARHGLTEHRLRLLARARVDVGVADERDGLLEDGPLPAAHGRRGEAGRELLDVRLLPALPAEDARGGVGRLGARGGARRRGLERLLRAGMVGAQAEQARDDLAAEAARGGEPGGA